MNNNLEKINQWVNQLSNEEYLQFIIDNHFKYYVDKKLFLSIYDTKRHLRMSTRLNEETYHYTVEELKGIPYEEFPHLQGHTHIINSIIEGMEYVIQHQVPVIFIIFDKYKDLLGAMHLKMDPILTPRYEVCGICTTHYDFTKLFFGVSASHLHNNKKNITNKSNLQTLTERQKHVLFLLALNMTQDIIAETLETTRGTIARIIAQICDKFSLSPSAKTLIDHLGRSEIIEQLTLPQAVVKPHLIRIIPDNGIINKK
jgi:DNA-binding CsgD family transcriptional regulator